VGRFHLAKTEVESHGLLQTQVVTGREVHASDDSRYPFLPDAMFASILADSYAVCKKNKVSCFARFADFAALMQGKSGSRAG
jgi:hypothetical protein